MGLHRLSYTHNLAAVKRRPHLANKCGKLRHVPLRQHQVPSSFQRKLIDANGKPLARTSWPLPPTAGLPLPPPPPTAGWPVPPTAGCSKLHPHKVPLFPVRALYNSFNVFISKRSKFEPECSRQEPKKHCWHRTSVRHRRCHRRAPGARKTQPTT